MRKLIVTATIFFLSIAAFSQSDSAAIYFQKGLDAAQLADIPEEEAGLLNGLGEVARSQGQFDTAHSCFEHALTISILAAFREHGGIELAYPMIGVATQDTPQFGPPPDTSGKQQRKTGGGHSS